MKRSYLYIIGLLMLTIVLSEFHGYAGINDFDLSNNNVRIEDFLSGGPEKDGIPALTNPKFVPANKASFLKDDDEVVGVVINGKAKAYPISILNWHEIVNDNLEKTPLAVTFCPLTKSAVTFDRRVQNKTLEFGVSGLLYNSNVVMYDRNHNGLWSQLKGGGLTGKHATQMLTPIASTVTIWSKWVEEHPDTLVLSKKTGHFRMYNSDPYASYHTSDGVMFPVNKSDERLPLKSLVLGIRIKGKSKAYPLELLSNLNSPIEDEIDGINIKIEPKQGAVAVIKDSEGNILPSVVAYWFAWSTFNKSTLVYEERT